MTEDTKDLKPLQRFIALIGTQLNMKNVLAAAIVTLLTFVLIEISGGDWLNYDIFKMYFWPLVISYISLHLLDVVKDIWINYKKNSNGG